MVRRPQGVAAPPAGIEPGTTDHHARNSLSALVKGCWLPSRVASRKVALAMRRPEHALQPVALAATPTFLDAGPLFSRSPSAGGPAQLGGIPLFFGYSGLLWASPEATTRTVSSPVWVVKGLG